MWISKAKYEAMESLEKNNEHDADLFRSMLFHLSEGKIAIYADMIIVTRDAYDSMRSEKTRLADRVKELEADLEWYKFQYSELRNKVCD